MAVRMIVLAAGEGTRLRPLTDDIPKCLVAVAGSPLLDLQIAVARSRGITDIAVVRGYRKEVIKPEGIKLFDNVDFETTNMVETLWCAESYFDRGFIVSYGDILYEPRVLEVVIRSDHPIGVVVDKGWRGYWQRRFARVLDDAESLSVDAAGRITSIGQRPETADSIEGQYIGLTVFRGEGVRVLRRVYDTLQSSTPEGETVGDTGRLFRKLYMTDLLQAVIDSGFPVREIPIERGWVEIDSLSDHALAESLVTLSGGLPRIAA